jgi:hypothetical protein
MKMKKRVMFYLLKYAVVIIGEYDSWLGLDPA